LATWALRASKMSLVSHVCLRELKARLMLPWEFLSWFADMRRLLSSSSAWKSSLAVRGCGAGDGGATGGKVWTPHSAAS
jgi:hypothetical protein